MTSLLISDDLAKRLDVLAAKACLSKTEYAEQLLEDMLDDQEDYLEALDSSLRIERGEEETIPYEDVLRQYENANPPH